MASALFQIVADRLAESPPAVAGAAELVMAAFAGPATLAAALGGQPPPERIAAERARSEPPAPQSAFLDGIEVEGFRGVGASATLQLAPGPGLTLVVGRNGSGKSSFAEALELILTGSSGRWSGRNRVWLEGWRNLHHADAQVAATFTVDGRRKPATLRRRWAPDSADANGSRLEVDGRPATGLGALGWDEALRSHRPMLSHNELGRVLDEPARLYDALASLLGLEELAAAQGGLRDARLGAEKQVKAATEVLGQLRPMLQQIDDDRARACLAATGERRWDLAAVEATITGEVVDAARQTELQRLRALSSLNPPSHIDAIAVAQLCRHAAREAEAVRDTSASVARDTASLLEAALGFQQKHDARDCPVCGTPATLSFAWRLAAQTRVDELREKARTAEAAHRASAQAVERALALLSSPSSLLSGDGFPASETATALVAWELWHSGAELARRGELVQVADHLVRNAEALEQAVAAVRQAAHAELERREDLWRPAARALLGWLPMAREAQPAMAGLPRLKTAEKWLRDAHDQIRSQRFTPIAAQVQANWTTLRQASNVSLGQLTLSGASTSRKLNLDVNVDGAAGSALGVMSQGELNCLALSLFLPRASMPESPFRFMVIDDPVQAMDPAKVEGLARVLQRAARSRQVVVFTHDDRLPEAVRRLDIAASIIEVTRREQSVVELREVLDPVARYIDDAFAVARSNAPPEALRVVPGFCRLALEAACAQAVTRRMLHEGRAHADVETALDSCTTLNTRLALTLFDDPARGGDVLTGLANRGVGDDVGVVQWCNRGAHGEVSVGDLIPRIRAAERLALAIAAWGRKPAVDAGGAGDGKAARSLQ